MALAHPPIELSIVTACALLTAWVGILATLRRGHWLTTLVFASSFLSMAAIEAGILALLNADGPSAARPWATYLAGVSALASWLWLTLSVVMGRPDPWPQIRSAGAYLALALIGCGVMFGVSGTPFIVREVQMVDGDALVMLGGMGKIYLMYLVVVMVAVLMNFERMLRTAPASARRRLRDLFLALLLGILTEMLVVSAGLLYGGLRASWLAASAGPLFVSGVVISFALARRRLSDMSVPLARPVIYYSSVSLTLAGAFLLTMAVLSKVLPILSAEWKRAATVAFYVIAGGGGVVLALSPRVNRAVKRFVDRNFYANRYDYRREWERVTNALTPTANPEALARQIDELLTGLFEAERTALYVRDESGAEFRRIGGPPSLPAAIPATNPLVETLRRGRRPLTMHELSDDLDGLPVVVENRELIHALNAAVCAPLAVGSDLVGLLWLAQKRADEEYSYEDVEFLAAVSRQIAAALWFARQAEQLATTRQLESLHRLSSFVLHDIKNQVSGLSLVLDNARSHIGNPEFQRDAMAVVERTVTNLNELMSQVASVARAPDVRPEPCDVAQLLADSLAASALAAGERGGVRVEVDCRVPCPVRLDRRQMSRVLVNLLTNARESLSAGGEIRVSASLGEGPGTPLTITVRDNGRGMAPEYVRQSLFRPFSSTKAGGFGIGLSQVKTIVEAHGGEIAVESKPGAGTTFHVRVPVIPANGVGAGS